MVDDISNNIDDKDIELMNKQIDEMAKNAQLFADEFIKYVNNVSDKIIEYEDAKIEVFKKLIS